MGLFLAGLGLGFFGAFALIAVVVFFGGLALVMKFLGDRPLGG